MKKYKTVLKDKIFSADYEINKSKFIATVKQIEDEESAREFLMTVKKKYYDATHNCSAWIIGVDGNKQKSNDDGEPSGTAGNPILETIKKNELVNVIVIVTRYFGGIKLGAGGLIRAYSHCASLGLNSSKIVTMTPVQKLKITIEYNFLASAENWIRNNNLRLEKIDYAEDVTLNLLLLPEEIEKRLNEITDLTSANFKSEWSEEILIAVEENRR